MGLLILWPVPNGFTILWAGANWSAKTLNSSKWVCKDFGQFQMSLQILWAVTNGFANVFLGSCFGQFLNRRAASPNVMVSPWNALKRPVTTWCSLMGTFSYYLGGISWIYIWRHKRQQSCGWTPAHASSFTAYITIKTAKTLPRFCAPVAEWVLHDENATKVLRLHLHPHPPTWNGLCHTPHTTHPYWYYMRTRRVPR